MMHTLDFSKLNQIASSHIHVIPCVVQNASTGEVITLAYVSKESITESIDRGYAVFWSTSRQELWVKGATSGNYLKLIDIYVNCENNSVLFKVLPQGSGACHVIDPTAGTHFSTCFHRKLSSELTIL